MKIIQAQGTLSKVSTLADKTIRLQIDTQELGSEGGILLENVHKTGHFAFALEEAELLKGLDIKDTKPTKGKTPSQVLRNRLWQYFQTLNYESEEEFNGWYRDEMFKIGQRYLDEMNYEGEI